MKAAAPIFSSHCISYHPEHPTRSSMTQTVSDSILRNMDNDVNMHNDYATGRSVHTLQQARVITVGKQSDPEGRFIS